jgi:hypothetical protein
MALKPSEAFHGQDFAGQVADAEKWIDQSLKAQAQHRGESPLTIAVDLRWTPAVVAELLKRYQAAGWQVGRVSDQRDGDYLRFEARKGD